MDVIFTVVQVLVGTFALFTVANVTYGTIGQRSGWAWIALVCALAVSNMVVHRLLGSTINPPFFTAICFGVTLSGLAPRESATIGPWLSRGVYAIGVGTILGWLSYAEIVSIE